MMRVGLFGGSFDPVHYGHLLLAECCREQCPLDKVLFSPAAVPPHKRDRELTPAAMRAEMLDLAIAGHEQFAVSRFEVERGGISYTIDTLLHFRAEHPGAEFFLLLGADMLHDLPHWHNAAQVCELAIPVAVRRAGVPEPDFACLSSIASLEQIERFRRHQVEMPEIGLSSTEIRKRVAAGRSVRYRTPRAVEKYIQTRALYLGENLV
ncbi:MAG: nicotinate-nucleotide adenylyltransferase [Thermoguttaceae bacterium]